MAEYRRVAVEGPTIYVRLCYLSFEIEKIKPNGHYRKHAYKLREYSPSYRRALAFIDKWLFLADATVTFNY